MASVRDWADAYLAQARADLEGAKSLGGAAPSVFAMLLQMVFEKLAKAALLRSGSVTLSWALGTHGAASRMLQAMRRQRGLLDPMGGAQAWEDVLWVIDTLEKAHPQIARDGPQLEYPWESAAGDVQWPARDLGIAGALGNSSSNLATRVLRFAILLGKRFDQIFP